MSGAAPTVTCVIPVRNGARFLGAALDSVVTQTRPPDEVIVVDDSSTDGSREIAGAYAPLVRVLEGQAAGAGGARNQGVAAASGELICFLDADDLFLPEKQERQLARFEARPELDVSLCTHELFWEEGMEDEEARYRAAGRTRGAHTFQTLMTRRSTFELAGPIDPRLRVGDVIDWLARADDAGAVTEVIDDVLVSRRMHPDSLTHVTPSFDQYVDVVKATLDRRRAAG